MLRKRTIEKVKVQCKHFEPNETTWEMVEKIRVQYPYFVLNKENVRVVYKAHFLFVFHANKNTKDGSPFKGVAFVTLLVPFPLFL